MDDNTKKELQSAAFERLISHLKERKDVQNIDLMNLAGFCRNCLSKWYREEAEKKGISVSEFFLNSSHPGILFFKISGLFKASQTFCFSSLI